MSIRNCLSHRWLFGIFLAVVLQSNDGLALTTQEPVTITHHNLSVELNPAGHELSASDRMTLEVPPHMASVTFTLAPTLRVESVTMGTVSASGEESKSRSGVSFTSAGSTETASQQIVVTLPNGHSRQVILEWTYQGLVNDPPREPRHLRFVTPSETAGHIGVEGVYLSGESQWYPDLIGSLSTFRATIHLPQTMTAVASGKKEAETTRAGTVSSTWVVRDRSEAFTLVANTFVTTSREWKSPTGQQVDLQTYLLPDNAALADEYLDATAKYLEAYVRILGDYPFEKFAVVENFFASGLGLPSFTLLGSGSIKRHYVQPYALGQEIVHSWIGNSVFNRDDHGNWVEGLTTYLANYYWHELVQDERQALEQRRMMLQGYNLYVSPDKDYPVAKFLRKHDEKDNAIGYHKSAFVFHLLRQELGDEPFWRGLKTFVREHRNRPADWGSIEEVFSRERGHNLRWFFSQWVEQSGAPVLAFGDVHARRVRDERSEETWRLTISVQQAGKPFRMAIPIRILMKDRTEIRWFMLSPSEASVDEFILHEEPIQVELDPELMTFRRLARRQLPPMLNSYMTDSHKTVMRAFQDPASPLQQIVSRITEQESPDGPRTKVLSLGGPAMPTEGSILMLAGADQHHAIQPFVQESCGDRVALRENGFQIDGQVYDGPQMAVLFSCPRVHVPGSVITVVYGVTSGAVEKVGRFLFYYGWHSYVIFQNGTVMKRDVWQGSPEVKEVRIDATF